ncbi:MAG: OprO/OprP family phosphate-selective porin [Sphingomonadales bacterium]
MNTNLRNFLKPLGLAILIIITVNHSALADGGWVKTPTPEYKSSDGKFTFKLRGRVYWDQSWATDENRTMDNSDNEFRAARLGFEGKVNKIISYKAEALLKGSEVDFTDLYLSYKGPAEFRFGSFKIATSLEESTSSRHITFMERGAFTDAFGFSRGLGVSFLKGGADWTIHAGAQKGNINEKESRPEGTLTIAGRATKSFVKEGPKIHLGVSIRYRKQDDVQSDLLYRQRPFAHLTDRFLNTGRIADQDFTYGLEAAFLSGSFAIQTEVSRLTAKLSNAIFDQENPNFKGGYIDFSWFITGEQRSYNPKKGSFGGIKPLKPTSSGGAGAVQLAVRFDGVDLSDQGIMGGSQTSVIGGINWYPNRWMRFMVNYSTTTINDGFLVAANMSGQNSVKTFGTRLQINW